MLFGIPDADRRVPFSNLFNPPLFLKETHYLFGAMVGAPGIMDRSRIITSNSCS